MTRKGKNTARLPAVYAKQISAITGADQAQTPDTSAPRNTQRGPHTPEGSPSGEPTATAVITTPHITIGTPLATELTPQLRCRIFPRTINSKFGVQCSHRLQFNLF